MSALFAPSLPVHEEVELYFPETGDVLRSWSAYTFNTNFLIPTDGFSMTVGGRAIEGKVLSQLSPGGEVALRVNGRTQATGIIDSLEVRHSRDTGTVYQISGRDKASVLVDTHVDPRTNYKQGQSLEQFLKTLFGPYGWTVFDTDNDANRAVVTGAKRGLKGARKSGKPLKNLVLHQLRPYHGEGLFAFAARVCQRHGLWLFPSGDAKTMIVGKPDFDQAPSFSIVRSVDSDRSTVLEGAVTYSVENQPSVIVADGFASGAAEFGKSSIRALAVNPAVTSDDVESVITSHGLAKVPRVTLTPVGQPVKVPHARVAFFHDDESKTQEQLNNYVRREMSLMRRGSVKATYIVEGHGQIVDGEFRVWGVDTVVNVADSVGFLDEPMYVLSRTFRKSRAGGTTTELELIRLHSLEF